MRSLSQCLRQYLFIYFYSGNFIRHEVLVCLTAGAVKRGCDTGYEMEAQVRIYKTAAEGKHVVISLPLSKSAFLYFENAPHPKKNLL